jgi:hypothetical protein
VVKVGTAPADEPAVPTPTAEAPEEFDALEAFLNENQGLGNITVSD